MKKQIIVSIVALSTLLLLFWFGKTSTDTKIEAKLTEKKPESFNIQSFINSKRNNVSAELSKSIASYEKILAENSTKEAKIQSLTTLANLYKDSLSIPEAYLYYTSSAAKLDNSEKNLTFAAQLFLSRLRGEQDEIKLDWETGEAISLFEKALMLNPDNDDLKIGLAGCYIFGKGRNGDPQQTMKGIQELLSVVRKDSTNMKAQLLLGIGGYVSGQYDKAISRLLKVVESQPDNIEAIAFLADTYAAKGEKVEAVKWYKISKRLVNDDHYTKEVDARITELEK
jgi:tetratricopeptide (TPR) repeat protein